MAASRLSFTGLHRRTASIGLGLYCDEFDLLETCGSVAPEIEGWVAEFLGI